MAVADNLDFPVRLEKAQQVLAHVGVVIGNEDSAPFTNHGVGRRDVRDLHWGRFAIRGPKPLASLQHGRVHAGGAECGVSRKPELLARQMTRAARNRNSERAATSNDALHANGPAMCLDQLADEREADPGALEAPTASALDAVKAVEDLRQ